MTVTEEGDGRLNAFAKEPEIVVINKNSKNINAYTLLIATGGLFLISIIGFSLLLK